MNPHRSLFSQHPLTQLAVAFATGICAAHYYSLGTAVVVGAVCSALAVGLVQKRRVRLAGLILLMAMSCAGVVLALLERRVDESSELKRFVNRPVMLTGVLDGPPEFARDRVYLSLRVESVDSEAIANGRVSLMAPFRNVATAESYRALQLRYGTRVSVRTTLDRTGNYRNPGVSPLHEYLDSRGYDATGIIRGPGSIARLDDTRVFPL
ncbi:MAG TPA: ComEC/Rec2 family competence protein, partial [Pyrinomonadaceae bacterium]|nr:ComEC/Rec2 family competence protein [Pyrinomonadaceae bacterium]